MGLTTMMMLPSLESTFANLIFHLNKQDDTALIAPPGCGTSTLLTAIKQELAKQGLRYVEIDFRSMALSEAVGRIKDITDPTDGRKVIVTIDHSADLLPTDFSECIGNFKEHRADYLQYLWIGPLDSRLIEKTFHCQLHTVSKSHISFPLLTRDELLTVYGYIGKAKDCNWGEAIKYLLLDLCGNDFSLVEGMTDYLYGDWTNKLYDASIWDRIGEWLTKDKAVNLYRDKVGFLPEDCKQYLKLIHLGGKPACSRVEFHEEIDDALRTLCLQGFLVQNLLPGYYQLRNLTTRLVIEERFLGAPFCDAPSLFRKATNERVASIINDIENMLRLLATRIFSVLGETAVRELLQKKQSDREFMPAYFNRDLLKWADKTGCPTMGQDLKALILENRMRFKEENSVWSRVNILMTEDASPNTEPAASPYLRYVEYLTFTELGDILITLIDQAFPGISSDGATKNIVESRWRESISKVSRLRNRVAHLRNVNFQDMEDLITTTDNMRKDLLKYTAWRDSDGR